MNSRLRGELIKIARDKQTTKDPSHDFQHVLRVMNMAENISRREKADLDVIIPAALFHDIVVYPKNSPKSKNENHESAKLASRILSRIKDYPKSKIPMVIESIEQCSFKKQILPNLLEAKILQDADGLEATGAISIMRTFSSGGQMNRPFYDPQDPFCQNGTTEFRSDLDLFYRRLLIVQDRMHTKHARQIAAKRTKFLRSFLSELKSELAETGVR